MKILTWNINGIRAASRDSPLKRLLDSLEADVICLQETKVTRDLIDSATAIVDGYNAFFSFSRVKGGYSGVATYCKTKCSPKAAEEGLTGLLPNQTNSAIIKCYPDYNSMTSTEELTSLDSEGRALLTEHKVFGQNPLVIVNLYCPRADRDNEERWHYKQKFYELVQARCEHLISCNKNVIIVGDFNVSHTALDHCDPDADAEYFASNESRRWMDQFLLKFMKPETEDVNGNEDPKELSNIMPSQRYQDNKKLLGEIHDEAQENQTDEQTLADGEKAIDIVTETKLSTEQRTEVREKQFIDLFRYFYPTRENAFTCWSTVTSARKTNYGTRIDYIVVNKEFLIRNAVSCDIRPDIFGSDHCPVEAVFSCDIEAADVLPELCSALMPEFKGKQRSIKSFMTAGRERRGTKGSDFQSTTYTRIEDTLESSEEGEGKIGLKRKASTELKKNPMKLQRKGSMDKKNSKNSNNSLKSYFQMKPAKSEIPVKPNSQETLKNFMKEANITDQNLQEEILRENVRSDTVAPRGDISVVRDNDRISCPENRQHNAPASCSSSQSSCITDEIWSKISHETVAKNLNEQKEEVEAKATQNIASNTKKNGKSNNKSQWKSILKGPDPPPLCDGHNEECVLRTVKKEGPNFGRQFYCCTRPQGRATDKEARCKTFIWKKK